ncbi:MAG: Ig-like domain-containing protein [Candidatus Methylarchaceae archaeon HK02M2]|nr:Ig-like domain-containing protein [Candidatus Methylarchaceae archaeon HK02M2]
MTKHTKQKRILVILFVALFFVSANILVFCTTEVQGVDIVESFDPPGEDPDGLAWDGNYLWNADNEDHKIYKLNPSTGEVVTSIEFSPKWHLSDLTWGESSLWAFTGDIYRINPSTGEVIKSFESPGKYHPGGLAWDGQSLWHSDYEENKINRINPSTGEVIKSFDSPGNNPEGLAWDGHYLWIATVSRSSMRSNAIIYKVSPSTGAVKDSFSYPDKGVSDLAWDGHYLWIIDNDDDKIYKIDLVAESRPSVEITTPSSGDTVQGIITIFAYAKDADGIDKVDFYIDGSLAYTDTNPSNNMYAYDWDSTSVSNGKCTVKITAYDNFGNTNSDAITVSVNNVALEEPIEPYWGNLRVGNEMQWYRPPVSPGDVMFGVHTYELEILAIYEKSLKVEFNGKIDTLTSDDLWPWIYPEALIQENNDVILKEYEYNGSIYVAAYLIQYDSWDPKTSENPAFSLNWHKRYEFWWDYSTGILIKYEITQRDYGVAGELSLKHTNANLTTPEMIRGYQLLNLQGFLKKYWIALVVIVALVSIVIVVLYRRARLQKKKNT